MLFAEQFQYQHAAQDLCLHYPDVDTEAQKQSPIFFSHSYTVSFYPQSRVLLPQGTLEELSVA